MARGFPVQLIEGIGGVYTNILASVSISSNIDTSKYVFERLLQIPIESTTTN